MYTYLDCALAYRNSCRVGETINYVSRRSNTAEDDPVSLALNMTDFE